MHLLGPANDSRVWVETLDVQEIVMTGLLRVIASEVGPGGDDGLSHYDPESLVHRDVGKR
jgi:hypothetical protein